MDTGRQCTVCTVMYSSFLTVPHNHGPTIVALLPRNRAQRSWSICNPTSQHHSTLCFFIHSHPYPFSDTTDSPSAHSPIYLIPQIPTLLVQSGPQLITPFVSPTPITTRIIDMNPAFQSPLVVPAQSHSQQSLRSPICRLDRFPHRSSFLPPRPTTCSPHPHSYTSSPTSRVIPTSSAAPKRSVIRIAIPSKGNILNDTKDLLANVGIDVQIQNPRQYVATLKGLDVEVWLQRPTDIVRKVRDSDVDLGIVGYDLVAEHGGDEGNVISVHERLGYGDCRLAVGIPMAWPECEDMAALRERSLHSELRVATKYRVQTNKFMAAHDISNFRLIKMEGALEASTQMGTADIIVDLVSSGTTLRENLLKEITGGTLLDSSMQFIANRDHLLEDSEFGERLRNMTKEILERIEGYLLGKLNYNIIANVRGSSMVDVSRRLATQGNLRGVDGPTISPVVPSSDLDEGMYAISIVVPKPQLYEAIQQLRGVGGSGVTVLPVSFIFPQQCKRWENLMQSLGITAQVA